MSKLALREVSDEVVGLYLAGMSSRKIATRYGVKSRVPVMKILRLAGVKVRASTDFMKYNGHPLRGVKGENNPNFGKRRTGETKKKFVEVNSGSRNPMFGKKHTEEWKRRMKALMSGSKSPNFGRRHSREALIKMAKAKEGKRASDKTRQKMSEGLKGEKHPQWRGGISKEPYPFDWTDQLKEAIRQRDGHRCVLCGAGQEEKKFSVHHIDYDKENLDPRNLVTLCGSCHSKTNSRRDYWPEYFRAMVLVKGIEG